MLRANVRLLKSSLSVCCMALLLALPAWAKPKKSLWETYISSGKQSMQLGDYTQARQALEEALKLTATFADNDPRLGATLHSLGNLCLNEQNYAQAQDYFERALVIQQTLLGADNLEVADALYGLALCCEQKGDEIGAEAFFKRVYEIWAKKLGFNHAKLISILPSLAIYASLSNDTQRAEQLYQQLINIQEANLGPNHPKVGASLNLLAATLANKGKYKEAELAAKRATSLLSSSSTAIAYDSAKTNLDFIQQKLAQDKIPERTPLLTQPAAVAPKITLAQPKDYATPKTNGSVVGSQEASNIPPSTTSKVETKEALRAPSSSIISTTSSEFKPWELKNQADDYSSLTTPSVSRHTNWGKIRYLSGGRLISQEEYQSMRLANEAYAMMQAEKYRVAVDILRKALANCPNLASAHTNLGLALTRLSQIEEAIAHFKKALAIDPSRSAPWVNLASSFQLNGQLKESVATYKEYLKRFPGDSLASKAKDLVKDLENEVRKQDVVENSLTTAKDTLKNDYFPYAAFDKAVKWKGNQALRVYISDGNAVAGFKSEYAGFLKDAFKQWESASGQKVSFVFVDKPNKADIDCIWTNDTAKISSVAEGGEAQISSSADSIEHATITVLTCDPSPDSPLNANQVRAVCLHEIGHALGLLGHSPKPQDIMYCSMPLADTKVELSARDISTLRRLYSSQATISLMLVP